MSEFLVTHERVAHRMVDLEDERHPELVRDVIDGMIRDFRLHLGAAGQGRIVYVPDDLPASITDRWVERHLQRRRETA